MANALNHIEKVLYRGIEGRLLYMIPQLGIDINIYNTSGTDASPNVADAYEIVYGIQAGLPDKNVSSNLIGQAKGIIANDAFAPIDSGSFGVLEEAWLFMNSALFNVDSLLTLIRDDGGTKEYKVDSKEAIGLTRAVTSKYRLTSVAD